MKGFFSFVMPMNARFMLAVESRSLFVKGLPSCKASCCAFSKTSKGLSVKASWLRALIPSNTFTCACGLSFPMSSSRKNAWFTSLSVAMVMTSDAAMLNARRLMSGAYCAPFPSSP